jgi:hypothetical protein
MTSKKPDKVQPTLQTSTGEGGDTTKNPGNGNGNGNGQYKDSHIWLNRTAKGNLLMGLGPEHKGQEGFPVKRTFIMTAEKIRKVLSGEVKGVMFSEVVSPS